MTTALDELAFSSTQLAHAETAVRVVQGLNLPRRAAVIVAEVGIVESDFLIDANPAVPSSLDIPHDGLSYDHDSVGIYQQRVPSWGTAADCMDVVSSTKKFLYGGGANPGLLNLPADRFAAVGFLFSYPDWTAIPTGSAAQAVQVSAFPDAYAAREAAAIELVNRFWDTTAPDSSQTRQLTSEEDDDMTLILNAGDRGQSGFWLSGGRAMTSNSAAARAAHKAALGRIEVWPADEFSRVLRNWS